MHLIERMRANDKTLHHSIFLGEYSANNNALDEALYYLLDKRFIYQINPGSESDKYFISYNATGRELHKMRSLENYFANRHQMPFAEYLELKSQEGHKEDKELKEATEELRRQIDSIKEKGGDTYNNFNFSGPVANFQSTHGDDNKVSIIAGNNKEDKKSWWEKLDGITKAIMGLISAIVLLASYLGIKSCQHTELKKQEQVMSPKDTQGIKVQ